MTPVRLSRDAEADLEDIGDFIALDNPARAASFVEELRQKARNIGYMPRAYSPRPNLGREVRIAIHGRYTIIFRKVVNEVVVLRIVHGARDLDNLFNE